MPRHVDVWLNGQRLQDAAPRLWIRQIDEQIAALDTSTASYAGWEGERLIRSLRRSLKVTITVQIHEVRDLAARSAALEALSAWMGEGGILSVSYRPDRRLRVAATAPPSLGKVRDYTQEIALELTAFACPYWEDSFPAVLALEAAASGETVLMGPGTVEAPLDLTVDPSADLTDFSVTCGASVMTLSGLSVPAHQLLEIRHTGDGFLTVTSGGVGLLSRRASASTDDLTFAHGRNAITWAASAACALTFSARGRYA